jgi:hypothetical protein
MEGVSMKIETIVCSSKEEAIKKISEIFDEAEKNEGVDGECNKAWVADKLAQVSAAIDDGYVLDVLAVLGITLARVLSDCIKPTGHGDVLGMFNEKVIAQLAVHHRNREKENETDGNSPVDGEQNEGIGNTNIH